MAALMKGMLRTVARKPCFWLGVRLETTLSSSTPMSAASPVVQPSSSSSLASTSATDSVTSSDGAKLTQKPATLPPLKYSVAPTGALFDTHNFVVKLKEAGRACSSPLYSDESALSATPPALFVPVLTVHVLSCALGHVVLRAFPLCRLL